MYITEFTDSNMYLHMHYSICTIMWERYDIPLRIHTKNMHTLYKTFTLA